jgi:GntR family transcriptional regulator
VTKQSETRDRVLDLIEQLNVGEAIPSERQLSSELGVSRLTVRAALDDLVREGYLVRRRGAGTFVSEPKIAQELTMTSFTDDMRRRGMRPSSRTLELRVAPAGARLGRLLHVSPSEPIVFATRHRLADGESMAIETIHVRERDVPGLTAADLEQQSFYELLRDRYGITVVGGTQTIEPTVTDEEESAALGVPLHSWPSGSRGSRTPSRARRSSSSSPSTAATATGWSRASRRPVPVGAARLEEPFEATARRSASRASQTGQYQHASEISHRVFVLIWLVC